MRSKLPLTLILVTGLVAPLSMRAADSPPTNLIVTPQAPTSFYPWKTAISATLFYIGDGKQSSNEWNKGWTKSSAKDDPKNRNGFSSGDHASLINPFYVALPFNDIAYPDKAKQYVPSAWQQSAKDGKSVCQHRWVEIKMEDGTGHLCYAQWEDVGPRRGDHAEYVFGSERPDAGDGAGIDVSPAVADYLGFRDAKGPIHVRWRFVNDEDVPPGQWIELEEQAVIYRTGHHSKDAAPVSKPAQIDPGSTKP